MKPVCELRASAILYNLLVEHADRRPFLMPANVCPIVPITYLKAGVPFAFVDISPVTLHMDLDAAADLLTSGQFGGLLYTHTYGESSTPNDFFATIKTANPSLLLIDDRCLCIPDLEYDNANRSDVVLYSTGYAKIADLGLGGYAFLSDKITYMRHTLPFLREDLEAMERDCKQSIAARQAYIYRDCNWLETEADLSEWNAYRQQVESALADSLKHRRSINALYGARLPVEIQLPARYQTWRFNLRIPRRDDVLHAIFAAGLFASAHYASLARIMAPGNCPNAEGLADQVINLFNDRHYTIEMAERVCDIILERYPL